MKLILIALSFALAVAALGQSPGISASPSATVAPGASFPIPFAVQDVVPAGPALTAVQFDVAFPSGFAASVSWSPGAGAVSSSKEVKCSLLPAAVPPIPTDVYRCVVSGMNVSPLSNSVVVNANVTVSPSQPAGDALVALTNTLGADPAASAVTVNPVGSPYVVRVALPVSPCDLNQSGATDIIDVHIAVDQALLILPCTDLNGDGRCTVVDVQKVANAAVPGGACVIP